MELNYTTKNYNSSEILFSAQTIADTFAEALQQNNCLLMVPLSLHQEIVDAVKDVTDLINLDKQEAPSNDDNTTFNNDVINSIASAVAQSKEDCFSCKLTIPLINFENDISRALEKLKTLFDTFVSGFKLGKLDLCQSGYTMRNSCLPDILKLIVLLLTAFIAIMTLKAIQSFSIIAFIKGVISALLGAIFGAVKLAIDIGGTNVGCIISALREMAETVIPSKEQIMMSLASADRQALSRKEVEGGLKLAGEDQASLSEAQKDFIHNALANDYTNAVTDAVNRVDYELSSIDRAVDELEDNINDTFKVVSDVMQDCLKEVNAYIANLLNFKVLFECEGKRSGMDILDMFDQVNKLIQVLNLLSAVAMSIARKDAIGRICSTQAGINSLSDSTTSDVQMKDIVQEYYGKEAELVEDPESGLQIIIHDKPTEQLLPKLDMFDCSIEDFVEAHKIENIIRIVEDNVRKEYEGGSNFQPIYKEPSDITEGTYVVRKPAPEELTMFDNIVNILYTDPKRGSSTQQDTDNSSTTEENLSPEEVQERITNIIGKDTVSNIFTDNNKSTSTLNCRSIDDVISVLDKLRGS